MVLEWLGFDEMINRMLLVLYTGLGWYGDLHQHPFHNTQRQRLLTLPFNMIIEAHSGRLIRASIWVLHQAIGFGFHGELDCFPRMYNDGTPSMAASWALSFLEN